MKYEEKIIEEYFSYNNIKTLLIIFFLHSGHNHSSVRVQNTTFVSFVVSFYFDGYFNSFYGQVLLLLGFFINKYLLFLHAYFTHIRMLSGALLT